MAPRQKHLIFLLPIALLASIQIVHLAAITSNSAESGWIEDHGTQHDPTDYLRQEHANRTRTPTNAARSMNVRNGPFTVTDFTQPHKKLESCIDLIAHEKGHWLHHPRTTSNISTVLNDSSTRHQYFPNEINWIKGIDLPSSFQPKPCIGQGEAYTSRLGNKCGCGTREFEPTHSPWVYPTDGESTTSHPGDEAAPHSNSIVRLVHRLINSDATLCFAGDSIDLQLYDSIHMQLRRFQSLQKFHFNTLYNVSLETREIPVSYRTKCGKLFEGHRPCGFKSMDSIKETLVFVNKESDREKVGRIRYYKFYGWSPWVRLMFLITPFIYHSQLNSPFFSFQPRTWNSWKHATSL